MFQFIYKLQKEIQKRLSEKGQGIVEYALILAAVAMIAIYVLSDGGGLTKSVDNAYGNAAKKIDTATTTAPGSTSGGSSTTPVTPTPGGTT